MPRYCTHIRVCSSLFVYIQLNTHLLFLSTFGSMQSLCEMTDGDHVHFKFISLQHIVIWLGMRLNLHAHAQRWPPLMYQ